MSYFINFIQKAVSQTYLEWSIWEIVSNIFPKVQSNCSDRVFSDNFLLFQVSEIPLALAVMHFRNFYLVTLFRSKGHVQQLRNKNLLKIKILQPLIHIRSCSVLNNFWIIQNMSFWKRRWGARKSFRILRILRQRFFLVKSRILKCSFFWGSKQNQPLAGVL